MKTCKHKFLPRYDEHRTTIIEETIKGKSLETIKCSSIMCRPYLKNKIYVHDICIKCGMIIKRTNK